MATILTKKSDTASSVPLVADLTNSSGGAELAVNTSDKRLFTKNSSNAVVELGTNPSTLSLPNGTANGVAYLNGSKVVTTGSALTFDGTTITTTGGSVYLNGTNSDSALTGNYVRFGTNIGLQSNAANSALVAKMFNGSTFFDALTLNTSGNFGLGVTPSAWGSAFKAMQIGGGAAIMGDSANSYISGNAYYNGTNWIYKTTNPALRWDMENGVHKWYTAPSGTAGNAISFTQAMTLDASGNLLVGTTSAIGSGKFSLAANLNSVNGIVIRDDGTTGGSYVVFYNSAAAVAGSISHSGTTAVLYNVTSDQRLKENIVDAPEFGSVIDSIKVRSYDWKADGSHQRAGFIAQELVTVAPEAVYQPEDPEQMMAVDYSKLVPMLVKEIQSLRARVAQLESK